jgi:hypothetical protein
MVQECDVDYAIELQGMSMNDPPFRRSGRSAVHDDDLWRRAIRVCTRSTRGFDVGRRRSGRVVCC